ncbi:MAG: hypothetical protein GX594_03655 [Pirellulaceae bacterium]|mgnify:CR=1 FL=1|nr:hypothetical protein [Pirellulaceae bacterium]
MHVNDGIALNHLDRMTDSTGLIQHAIYSIPRRESGYTTDDNARALRLCARLWEQRPGERMLGRVTTYLSFLEHARCPVRGFHNFLSYQRDWLDTEGTSDSQGQAIRALAEVLGSSLPDGYRALARELIKSVAPALADLRSLRAQAYVIMAWGHLSTSETEDLELLENVAWSSAKRLVECYRRSQRPDWPWFESRMTYANAVLPHAMFVAARCWPEEDFLEVAEASFDFLDRETAAAAGKGDGRLLPERPEDCRPLKTPDPFIFWPVGNSDWYPRGEEKSLYDQQPVEAVTMADAAMAGFTLLGDKRYLAAFRRANAWLHGQNSLQLPLVDVDCGSCYDGLQPLGVNRNQGAESTLAYLWAELNNKEYATCVENQFPINTRSYSNATATTLS